MVGEFDSASTGALEAIENGWRFDAAQRELTLLAQLAARAGIRPPRTFSDVDAAWALRQEWAPIAQVVSHQLLRTAILNGESLNVSAWAKAAMADEPEAVALALRGRGDKAKHRWYELAAMAIAAQDTPDRPVIAFNAAWRITTCTDSVSASVIAPIFVLDPDPSSWDSSQVALDSEDPLVVVEDRVWQRSSIDAGAKWLEDEGHEKWLIADSHPIGDSLVAVAQRV